MISDHADDAEENQKDEDGYQADPDGLAQKTLPNRLTRGDAVRHHRGTERVCKRHFSSERFDAFIHLFIHSLVSAVVRGYGKTGQLTMPALG